MRGRGGDGMAREAWNIPYPPLTDGGRGLASRWSPRLRVRPLPASRGMDACVPSVP